MSRSPQYTPESLPDRIKVLRRTIGAGRIFPEGQILTREIDLTDREAIELLFERRSAEAYVAPKKRTRKTTRKRTTTTKRKPPRAKK